MKRYLIVLFSVLLVLMVVLGVAKGIPYVMQRRALVAFDVFPLDDVESTYHLERNDRDEVSLVYTRYAPASDQPRVTERRVRAVLLEQLAYNFSERDAFNEFFSEGSGSTANVRVTGAFYCYKGGKQRIDKTIDVCGVTHQPTLVIDTIELAP